MYKVGGPCPWMICKKIGKEDLLMWTELPLKQAYGMISHYNKSILRIYFTINYVLNIRLMTSISITSNDVQKEWISMHPCTGTFKSICNLSQGCVPGFTWSVVCTYAFQVWGRKFNGHLQAGALSTNLVNVIVACVLTSPKLNTRFVDSLKNVEFKNYVPCLKSLQNVEVG